jgi:sn-glycerol 3-phosphate transport system ATP-binding protein
MREGLAAETAIEVGIRPEDVRLLQNGTSAFQIDIDFIEELGATQLLHGRIDGAEFVVQAPTGQTTGETRQLSLGVDARNVHLFDPATGVRLGRAT